MLVSMLPLCLLLNHSFGQVITKVEVHFKTLNAAKDDCSKVEVLFSMADGTLIASQKDSFGAFNKFDENTAPLTVADENIVAKSFTGDKVIVSWFPSCQNSSDFWNFEFDIYVFFKVGGQKVFSFSRADLSKTKTSVEKILN